MAKRKQDAEVTTIPVQYGDISVGELIARVSVKVDREALSIVKADKLLVGKRLVGQIRCRPGNNNADQPSLTPEMETSLDLTFDVKSIGFNTKRISFALSAAIASLKIEELAGFAKRSGEIVITSAEEIPARGEDDED